MRSLTWRRKGVAEDVGGHNGYLSTRNGSLLGEVKYNLRKRAPLWQRAFLQMMGAIRGPR